MRIRSERGITLTELTVVMIVAALVMVGLVTFYLNSQGMWIDASTQAIAQRDATFLMERLTSRIHESSTATVSHVTDPQHCSLQLQAPDALVEFVWNESDERVHYRETVDVGGSPTIKEYGPLVGSKVTRFEIDTNGTFVFVRIEIDAGVMRPIQTGSTILLHNRPGAS